MELLSGLATIIIMTISITAVFVLSCGVAAGSAGKAFSFDMQLILEQTAALFEYVIFILMTSAALLLTCSFGRVSNHIVISLDIIFILNSLILVMYHTLKLPVNLQSKL